MKILFTGFEPFAGGTENASWEAVSLLPDCVLGAEIIKRRLPVEYDAVGDALLCILNEIKPDAAVCVGQAAGRGAITPEKVAINWKFSRCADNAGVVCSGDYVCADGDAAYFSTAPAEKIADAISEAGVRAQVSFSAGTFVCNAAMYWLLHVLKGSGVRAGFIHVPDLGGEMMLPDIVSGLRCAAEVIVREIGRE